MSLPATQNTIRRVGDYTTANFGRANIKLPLLLIDDDEAEI